VVRKAERPPEPVIELTQVERTLEEAEEMYRRRDLEEAGDLFMRALRESDERPAKAKAYYGLARTATLQNDPELAVSLFERALTFSPEPRDKAWILVYLGRLSDVAGDTEKAAGYYRNALAIDQLSDSARAMAEKGAAGAFRRGSPRQ
jgi:tetratricopeptide (TPR) repeat protein